MSLLKNLTRIVEAPIQILDKTIIEPLAEVADAAAEGFGAKEEDK
jgi:hypothetical protein